MSLRGAKVNSATETAKREGGEPRNGGKVGGVFVAMAKGPLSSCWFACAVAHPFPFFLLPPSFLICVPASHSDKRFVHCVVGCGPFCFRAFTPSATHRDGRPCLPNTGRGFLQVRRENLCSSHNGVPHCGFCECFSSLTHSSTQAVALHHYRGTEDLRKYHYV